MGPVAVSRNGRSDERMSRDSSAFMLSTHTVHGQPSCGSAHLGPFWVLCQGHLLHGSADCRLPSRAGVAPCHSASPQKVDEPPRRQDAKEKSGHSSAGSTTNRERMELPSITWRFGGSPTASPGSRVVERQVMAMPSSLVRRAPLVSLRHRGRLVRERNRRGPNRAIVVIRYPAGHCPPTIRRR